MSPVLTRVHVALRLGHIIQSEFLHFRIPLVYGALTFPDEEERPTRRPHRESPSDTPSSPLLVAFQVGSLTLILRLLAYTDSEGC